MSNNFILSKPTHGIIGHRGVAGHAPENTLASMKAAKAMGLDWVEIDIRPTKTGELVVFHDPTLDRTTNGKGRVMQHDLDSLKSLDAGIWFAPKFEGETIPTLVEAIDCMTEIGLTANLEVKCPPTTGAAQIHKFAKKLVETLKLHWPIEKAKPLVSSFNLDFILAYRELAPGDPIGILADRISNKIIELVKSTPNCTLHCGKRHLTPKVVENISSQGIPLLIYTINDKELGQSFLDAGAFALFSDNPDVFM